MLDEPPVPQPSTPPAITCPWCAYTAPVRKQVLTHMEAVHPQRWRDLALGPPVAGGGVT